MSRTVTERSPTAEAQTGFAEVTPAFARRFITTQPSTPNISLVLTRWHLIDASGSPDIILMDVRALIGRVDE
jgi:hypothetical protein